jgi:hypothetical protein
MARSNSVDFTDTKQSIIDDAAMAIGVKSFSQVLSADDNALFGRILNRLAKQYQGKADFAPGNKEWARRRATVFLQKDQVRYSLGPTGDHAADEYVSTTLTALASSTTLTVASIANITSGDHIGVVLNTGYFHWTTVNGAPSGSTVTLTVAVPSPAASGQPVYAYTSKMRRPIDLLSAFLRTDETDAPLDILGTVEKYDEITDKLAEGTVDKVYLEGQLDNAVLYVHRAPDDVEKLVKLTYLSPIEDFDGASNTPDYPAEVYRALVFSLAVDAAPSYGRTVSQDLKDLKVEAVTIAQNLYPETCELSFEPDRW